MTSVPQLPIEAPSANALPKGEPARGRSRTANDDREEGSFAAALAHALPESQQKAKPAQSAEGERTATSAATRSEDGKPSAEEVKTAAVSDSQPTTPEPKPAGADEPVTLDLSPVVAVLSDIPTVKGAPFGATTQEAEQRPAAPTPAPVPVAPDDRSAELQLLAREVSDQTPVAVDDFSRPEAKRATEESVDASAPEADSRRETTAPDDGRTAEQPRVEPQPADPAGLRVQAIVSDSGDPQPESAPDSPYGEQPRRRPAADATSAAPALRAEVPRGARGHAAESARSMPSESLPASEAPVIEFRVARSEPAEPERTEAQPVAWASAETSVSADDAVEPEGRRLAEPLLKPFPQTPTAEPTAQTTAEATLARRSETVVPAVLPEAEPSRADDSKRTSPRATEDAAVRRIAQQPTVVASLGRSSRGGEEQAEQGESKDLPGAWTESFTHRTAPSPQALGAQEATTIAPIVPAAETGQLKADAVKPTVVAAAAGVANADAGVPFPQVAQGNPAARSVEDPRPTAAATPASEPAVAAKLQQESGRTTLSVVLQDERMGRVALQLVERGGWIETAIRASDPRTAQTLSNGASALFEALQNRGLSLSTGSGASAWDAQEGQRRENPQRDQESQRRRFRLRRGGGEFEGALARAEI